MHGYRSFSSLFVVIVIFIFVLESYAVLLNPDVINSILLESPRGIAISPVTRALFVSDFDNNRILKFDDADSVNSATTLNQVIGQQDLMNHFPNQGTGQPSRSSLSGPQGIWVDERDTLWVADST